jgi:predicted  nucleic acid-binding Zn-ribbon protein
LQERLAKSEDEKQAITDKLSARDQELQDAKNREKSLQIELEKMRNEKSDVERKLDVKTQLVTFDIPS